MPGAPAGRGQKPGAASHARSGSAGPQRATKRRRPRLHDGRIITDAPNIRWGTDATMAWTKNDGWVWVFALLDHYSDEAWAHVAKVGNRFAALPPVYDAVVDRFGGLSPNVARGIKLRDDWGSQTGFNQWKQHRLPAFDSHGQSVGREDSGW